MTVIRAAILAGLMLGTSAQAQESCSPEFQKQKLELLSENSTLSRLLRRLQARLDGQEMRLADLDPKLRGSVPAAPELPAEPKLVLAEDQGCTTGLDAELGQVASLKAVLMKLQDQIAAREDALSALENGETPAPKPADAEIAESAAADVPKTSDAGKAGDTQSNDKPVTDAKPRSDAMPKTAAADVPAGATAKPAPEPAPAPDVVANDAAPTTTDAVAADAAAPAVTASAATDQPSPDNAAAPEVAAASAADTQNTDANAPDAATEPDAPAVADAVSQEQPADPAASDVAANDASEGMEPTPADLAQSADAGDAVSITPAAAPEAQAALPDGPQPLTLADNPDLFQRVLSLPELRLYDAPGLIEGGANFPAFSVLYVYERRDVAGEPWLALGSKLNAAPQGWAKGSEAVDWSSMLVMQFAPRGKRNRVLFFDESGPLKDIVASPFYQTEASGVYDKIASERRKLADDPAYQPQWNADLVAIEPETAVRYDDKPYLLPILDWQQEMFDGTIDTTMVKVAALPAQPQAQIGARDDASFTSSASEAAAQDDEFRVGVVFVVDTSISMRPFIERTYAAIEGFYNAFSQYESAQYVTFGLMGFRDTIETDSENLEYVTRNFQPLDPEAPQQSILRNMRNIAEARVSNLGFEEDAIAGLVDAIDENDWTPYDAKLIVLVTDASARTDGKSKYPDMTVERLREKARAQNITIVPVHLQTPANQKLGDEARARAQYEELAKTGDIAQAKYIPLDANTDESFARQLEELAQTLASRTMRANAGEVVREAPSPETPAPPAAEPVATSTLSDVVENEIFRAQLESLGRVEGSAAPAFMAGWAADRDLTNPDVETLEVSVYLTRNQLSTLDKRLEEIVQAFRSGGQDPQAFFANLQLLAAQTSTDPESLRQGDRATIEAILPGFLKNLPYRSQVLRLDQSYWASMSVSQQQEFIESLEAKRRIYADLFGETGLWADFGAGDPGLEATPVRLVNLP